ncbi:MAG: polyphosphate kinase [Actinomycetota bacterium]|nr:polyphosphate kinase [Actinomycetota bacterium]
MAGLDVAFDAAADGDAEGTGTPHRQGPPLSDPAERFLNRELSWLEFNARVLALAEDPQLPLLERAKFLAIFSQNLDEFFEVRVSGLMEQLAAGLRTTTPDGLDLVDQLRAIRSRVAELVARSAAVFANEVTPALEAAGIRFADWDDLSDDDRSHLEGLFAELIFPVLTPLAVDPAHPFPYISNLSLNLAVTVRDPSSGDERFARVKVPPLLPRFVALPDGERFVLLEQVIAAKLGALFPGMEVLAHHPFRVTRDADFELEDEAEDLLEAIESVLRRRSKFGRVVRLEVDTKMTNEVLELLCRELELADEDVNVIDGPLDLGGLWSLYELDRPELKDDPWVPQTQVMLQGTDPAPDFFRLLRSTDVLVHHPYDSFATSVEQFVEQAAADPHVLAIKQTIYRTAGAESALVGSLVKAAEQGKQVVALVELKARFDEQANIARARVLEEAGVHVVYGLVGLKTHAKVLLVVRQESDGIRRYCHVGTGNYNPRTAHLYEDLGLLSADPDLGADLTDLFNHLTGYSHQGTYRKLLVAPSHLRRELAERIEHQAGLGTEGRIILKMNSLVDPAIIDMLYDASQRGVQIDLVVRGICCLRPQVPGLSENIRVRSILGRFLEHSRVYRFGADPETAEYLIGSADLMPRNLDHRVEALVPVTDPRLRARLAQMLELNLGDDTLAWELLADGTWHKIPTVAGISTHRALQELAVARAHIS